MQKGFNVVNLHGTASGVIAVPVIGENGNWWIGNEDTGTPAQGPKGETGEPGSAGIGSEKIYSEESSPSRFPLDTLALFGWRSWTGSPRHGKTHAITWVLE